MRRVSRFFVRLSGWSNRCLFAVMTICWASVIIFLPEPAGAVEECRPCLAAPENMVYGDCVVCSISPSGDTDDYLFSGELGEVITIRATKTGGSGYPCIELRDPADVLVATDCGLTGAQIERGLSSGTYTIRVSEDGNNGTYSYVLSLERIVPPAPGATPLLFGETVEGDLNPEGDVDLYSFNGWAGDNITIELRPLSSNGACVELWSPQGIRLGDEKCSYGTSQIAIDLLNSGPYTIRTRSYTASGAYRLSLNCSGKCPPELTSVTVPANEPWVDSGISVNPGDIVSTSATGLWYPDPSRPSVSVMGRAEPCGTPSCPIQGNHGALIGRIGSHPAFFVGDGFRFDVDSTWSGNLQFMINDDTTMLDDNAGSATVLVLAKSVVSVQPQERLALDASAPNPFVESTTIHFTLPERSIPSLRVYDVAGRVIRTLFASTVLEPGEHVARWDGRGDDGHRVAPGVYFYRLKFQGREQTRRAILLK